MSYAEWKSAFVDGGDKEGLTPYNLQFFSTTSEDVRYLSEYMVEGIIYKVDGKHVLLESKKWKIVFSKNILWIYHKAQVKKEGDSKC